MSKENSKMQRISSDFSDLLKEIKKEREKTNPGVSIVELTKELERNKELLYRLLKGRGRK